MFVSSKIKGLFLLTGMLLALLALFTLHSSANVSASENIIECVLDSEGHCNDTRAVLVQISSDEVSDDHLEIDDMDNRRNCRSPR